MQGIIARDGQAMFSDVLEPPPCPPDGALVRVRLAGDDPLSVLSAAAEGRGGRVLGRDLVGVVAEVGPEAPAGVADRLRRARVACSPRVARGTCDMCRAGVPQHCRDGGTIGWGDFDGTMATSVALPWRNLALAPEGLDDADALLAGPLARAIHAARMIRMEGKVYVTVLGDNLAALLASQVIAQLNATVRLLGWKPEVFSRAERWGVQHRHADEVGRRRDQTVVVDCQSTDRSLDLALGLVRPRGTVILAGPEHATARLDPAPVIAGELEVIGAGPGPTPDALAMLASGKIDTTGLVEVRARPSEAPRLLSRSELLYAAFEF